MPLKIHSLPAITLIGIAITTISADILGTLSLGLTPTLANLSLILGGTFAAILLKQQIIPTQSPQSHTANPISLTNKLLLFCFALVSFRSFCWLLFENNGAIRISSANNLADLPWHLSLIQTFASGIPLWPDSPNFTNIKLHYPAGINLFNAVTLLAGIPLYSSLIATGLICSTITAVTLQKWGKSFALAAFLFNGGITGFEVFKTWTPTDFQNAHAWKSIFLSLFVPQRGFLYAFPAGLLLLSHWKDVILGSKTTAHNPSNTPILPFWAEVILYSTLPLFHAHTFLFLSLVLAFWSLTAPNKKHTINLVLISVLPATFFVSQITGIFDTNSIPQKLIHLQIGWMQKGQPFFQFWFTNFGILPILVLALFAKLTKQFLTQRNAPHAQKARKILLLTVPALLIYILCLIVCFAPWDWDNTKLMIWSYLIIMPFLWTEMISKWHPVLRTLTCFALFTSGAITLYSGTIIPHNFEIARITDYYSIKKVAGTLKPGAIYVTSPTYNHPLTLAGQHIACGYPAHLWSHGIDPTHQINQINSILNGERDWLQKLELLGATYLFWGTLENEHYPNSQKPWEGNYPVVAAGHWGKIYQITP